ncbi:MAG: hypothetical protein E6Q99_06290 [Elusimicrobia bacterium]|nr:MAG: hypothetical protein E6Q99_06290 [Elusimicrobiota bacterium]
MKKLLGAIKAAVQGEPWTNAKVLNLTAVEQDAALAGSEIDAAHRLLMLVFKARHDANVLGKDLVADSELLATIQRARKHKDAAMQRLEKAAAEFAGMAQDMLKERRAWALAKKLNELRGRLSDLDATLRKLPIRQTTQPEPAKTKRWTAKAIVAKARAAGLRIAKSRKGNDITVWNHIGGITLWENGSATRADVRADLATKMTLRQAAEFLFPDER